MGHVKVERRRCDYLVQRKGREVNMTTGGMRFLSMRGLVEMSGVGRGIEVWLRRNQRALHQHMPATTVDSVGMQV